MLTLLIHTNLWFVLYRYCRRNRRRNNIWHFRLKHVHRLGAATARVDTLGKNFHLPAFTPNLGVTLKKQTHTHERGREKTTAHIIKEYTHFGCLVALQLLQRAHQQKRSLILHGLQLSTVWYVWTARANSRINPRLQCWAWLRALGWLDELIGNWCVQLWNIRKLHRSWANSGQNLWTMCLGWKGYFLFLFCCNFAQHGRHWQCHGNDKRLDKRFIKFARKIAVQIYMQFCW